MIDPTHKQATGGKRNHDRRAYPASEPLTWRTSDKGHNAECRGHVVYVQQYGGWGWGWSRLIWSGLHGRSCFATEALAMADAERELVSPPAKVLP